MMPVASHVLKIRLLQVAPPSATFLLLAQGTAGAGGSLGNAYATRAGTGQTAAMQRGSASRVSLALTAERAPRFFSHKSASRNAICLSTAVGTGVAMG